MLVYTFLCIAGTMAGPERQRHPKYTEPRKTYCTGGSGTLPEQDITDFSYRFQKTYTPQISRLIT
jgi:hypothetical protein